LLDNDREFGHSLSNHTGNFGDRAACSDSQLPPRSLHEPESRWSTLVGAFDGDPGVLPVYVTNLLTIQTLRLSVVLDSGKSYCSGASDESIDA